jgi:hypothetical protein
VDERTTNPVPPCREAPGHGWFVASAVLAVVLFARGRLASYLVLTGSVVAGALFIVAAIGATG